MEQLEQRKAAVTEQGEALLAALRDKVAGMKLGGEQVVIPPLESATFTLEYDLYNGQQTLMASFYPSQHYRAGFLLFHSDGSCFAEYHVMQLHPTKPKFFVEAVEAWVRDGEIKTDTRLAVMPQ
ncbi:MAG: hypothetical protein GC139_01975 [Sideroxydans sp.]|nr:hypothetical protein [Sideroxydans sp.]